MQERTALTIATILLALIPADAAVVDSSAAGFTVGATLTIQAKPEAAYAKLLQVGEWWDPVHTFSGNAHNLSLEPRAMGCFCEKLTGGGGVRHMEVVFVAPGKRLVMTGGIGPMQSMAASGSMTIEIAPAGEGTTIKYSYAVFGYSPAGMNSLAPIVDTVLGQQFARLVNYVERGNPTAAAQK